MSSTTDAIPATSDELNITTKDQLQWTALKLIGIGAVTLAFALCAIFFAASMAPANN